MIYHGQAAIEALERDEGIELNEIERRTVMCEGYSTEPYPDSDTPPTLTNKVGQTGEWLHRPFRDAFLHHVERAKAILPNWRTYPTGLKAELMQACYRGDLVASPKACRLMREGKWEQAAVEWLDHAEFQDVDTPKQIKKRILAVHYALLLMECQQ